jgi:hypothetical protein
MKISKLPKPPTAITIKWRDGRLQRFAEAFIERAATGLLMFAGTTAATLSIRLIPFADFVWARSAAGRRVRGRAVAPHR